LYPPLVTEPAEKAAALAPPSTSTRTSASRSEGFRFGPPHADVDDIAEVRFVDGDGRRMSLADFRGKNVLLNVWATWCGPCREEMPTLDRLQARLGSADFEVVALSIDRGGLEVVRDFYRELGLKSLRMYVDDSGMAAINLNVLGLPSTLLLDREGREIGRYIGPTVWDSEPVIGAIQKGLGDTIKQRTLDTGG
jgi:thiol-disulfide isomerase/thioredoxin